MKPALLLSIALLAACAPARAPITSPAPASSTPAISSAPPIAASASAAPLASAPSHSATDLEPDVPDTPAHPRALVVFDPPYKLGARPRLPDPTLEQRENKDLAAWNRGGRDGKFHPEPRVVVDAIKAQGALTAAVVQREARKNAYGAVRKCYDAALAKTPQLSGKLRVQLTIRRSGAVGKSKASGRPTLDDKDAVSCLVAAMKTVQFPAPPRGDVTAVLELTLNPGDLPMRLAEDPPVEPGPGRLDANAALALVAGSIGKSVQHCYDSGLARVPGLWGRLALRADIAPEGSVRAVTETESAFPDAETGRCVSDALARVAFPAPRGGELRLVVPLRFGKRPLDDRTTRR